jgi:hypothetical protein
MKYSFTFPGLKGETIITDGETYGEAADKAIEERTKHVTPLKADGELYEQKPSLTHPVAGSEKK